MHDYNQNLTVKIDQHIIKPSITTSYAWLKKRIKVKNINNKPNNSYLKLVTDLTIEVLAVSPHIITLLEGAEGQEMRGAMNLMVEFLRVR